jgi:hypothetical protein
MVGAVSRARRPDASLSIGVGAEDRVLLCCHAGCATESVLAALELGQRDLFADDSVPPVARRDRTAAKPSAALPSEQQIASWTERLIGNDRLLSRLRVVRGWSTPALALLGVGYDDRWSNAHGGPIVFATRDAIGRLVGVSHYQPNPERRRGRKIKGSPGSARDLFPAPEAIRGDVVWIVEGEPDAVSAATVGLPATALPGVEFAKRLDVSRFERFARVNIVLDCDPQGREAAATVARRLGEAGIEVRVLDLDPGRSDGYDLGELVRDAAQEGAEGLASARTFLERMARDAPPFNHQATSDAECYERDQGGVSSLVPFSEIMAKPVRWAWQDRIALAKITALAGRPKIGKGLLYSRLIAQVTTGRLKGDVSGPRDAILVTTEDDPGDTLKPRVVAAGADVRRVSMFQMGSREDPIPFRVPQDADALRQSVEHSKAALVVIDPLVEFIDGKVDSHKSHPVRQAIASLNAIARDTGCAILVIFHLNKGNSTDPLLRHEGSAAFTQVVRGGMLLGHDPDDPDGEAGSQRVLAVTSSNLARLAPSLAYEISPATVMGDTGEEITTAAIEETGESDLSGYDLLKHRGDDDGGEQTAEGEAAEFLIAELRDAPKAADALERAAKAVGISQRTLERARAKLRKDGTLKCSKTGFDGGWEWFLRSPPTDDGGVRAGAVGGVRETPINTGDSDDVAPEVRHSVDDGGVRADGPSGGVRMVADLSDEELLAIFPGSAIEHVVAPRIPRPQATSGAVAATNGNDPADIARAERLIRDHGGEL